MLSSIEEAIKDIKKGKLVIVVDDENRENEGDFIGAAQKVSAKMVNFMAKYGRGLICAPLTPERLEALNIPIMVNENTSLHGTHFTVSVDYKKGTTTGISAYDRAKTIKALIDPKTRPEDLARPGHVFPLRAVNGGVLRRAGHTEASVDLARLAGLYPAGVLCEIMDSDGRMARLPKLKKLARQFGLKIISIKDLIAYRRKKERLIERILETDLPTKYGKFKLILYEDLVTQDHHIALVLGDVRGKKNVLVRVHSQCLTGDVFHSFRCDCGDQLDAALRLIAKNRSGVFVYMRQEGRGIGLVNKLKAYRLQDKGLDTVEANLALGFPPDLRDYGIGAQILVDLGLSSVKLLTNNPKKIIGLKGYGLKVTGQIPIFSVHKHNVGYLKTKRNKLGHLIPESVFAEAEKKVGRKR
ncbi:bifunctional 3,4-dihydroxy-2-butanone 4-phosphate synthase/GTP cyclohydrolase II [candidate division WOR-3 bacterium 4484_100]|uniref:Riboflavin biosynthesis protein RibBA n=1 Tax=candidate division WOR-3 bacterium 4484_100 TaxID=1936077 RepID=A0A1V4QGT0_UNCW3|nr:MAG: bifunctional 3,4-dihydroxy-2-butanone 4-phosphate synthase/GTP cyclohydrolase II [candidate division WOR-3 bacterium 4484_100]